MVAVIATWATLQAQPRDTRPYTSRHLSPEQLRELREDGDILSLESIISLIRKNKSDRLLEVELLEKNNILFYKVEILEQSGIIKKYFLDPRTGKSIPMEFQEYKDRE